MGRMSDIDLANSYSSLKDYVLPHFRLVVCASECECVTPNTRDTKWEGGTRRRRSGVLHEACERKGRGQPHVRLRPEEGEGGRKILAVFLPSFTSILLSPSGLRLLRARRGRGGRWTAAKMPIPFAAADCPGRRERGVARSVGGAVAGEIRQTVADTAVVLA